MAPSSNCVHARACVSASHFFVLLFFFLQELAETKHHLHAAGRPGCLLFSLAGAGERLSALREHCYERAPSAAAAFFSAAAALRLLMLTANNVLLDDCAPARSCRVETETNRGRVKE